MEYERQEFLFGVTGNRVDRATGELKLLSDDLRSSRFVEFKTGILLIVAPMHLTAQLDDSSSTISKVNVFECRMEVWHLAPAIQVLRMIETANDSSVWAHAGFGLVAMFASYFEVIGKILNDKSNGWRSGEDDFAYEFQDVYKNASTNMVEFVRDRMRNGTYHLGFPKGGFWINHDPSGRSGDFSFFGETKEAEPNACVMDPLRVICSIVDHFGEFRQRLWAASSNLSDPLSVNFLRFFDELPRKYAVKKTKS